MVDKPKTYPQKVAELQELIAAKDSEIEKLRSQVESIPTLQEEVNSLKTQIVTAKPIDNKAQMVDLTQRAELAEAQLRNLNTQFSVAVQANEQLAQQLDIAGAERDKNLGKDQKIEQLSEAIKQQNNRIANFNVTIADVQRSHTEDVAKYEKQVNSYRQLAERQGQLLANFISVINSAPDTLSELKRIAGSF